MFMGISVSSDNNLPDLAGENPFCPCKTEVSLHLCSCKSPAFKAFHSRGHGEMVQAGEALPCLPALRLQRCKLWRVCLLLAYRYEYRHGSPQLVSHAKVYLKPAKFPCTAGKNLSSILLQLYCYLLSNMLLAGAYLVAPSAFRLSRLLPLSWLQPCCPFCSE